MDIFDIESYRDPKDPSFFTSLKSAPQTLQPTQADEFFRLSMSYIPKLRKEFGVIILNTIRDVIQDENIRFIFIHNHHFENLPYNKQFCQVPIIRIMISFLEFDFSILELHWEIIADCISLNPLKWLSFIMQYSQNYLQSQDPYSILDILFKQEKYFSIPEILPKYVQFLTHLCVTYPEYRDLRIQHCWNQIASFLSSHANVNSLVMCYDSLCILAPYYENRKCPLLKVMKYICLHLNNDTLADHVLALLSLKCFSVSEVTESNLIESLIKLAKDKKEAKAVIILMQLADVEQFSYLFINDTSWMKYNLPIIIDTLRLFLVVFKHSSLRPAISKSPYFVPFLLNLVCFNHPDIFRIVCLILHRIPLTEELVQRMVDRKLVEAFLQNAISTGSASSLNDALVFVDAIVSVMVPVEFVGFCDTVADLAKNNRRLSANACHVAAKLSDNRACLMRLRQLGMVDFFRKMRNNDERAIKFLQNVEELDFGAEDYD